jgi:hypothetical protein
VAALLLFFAVLFTWPLAAHLRTDVLYTHEALPGYERVPLAHGDHLQLLYQYWLLGDSLREGRSLVRDPYQFRGGGPPGVFFQPSLLPLLTLLLSPLGLIAAYNVLTLLSFVAAGLSAHLLLRLETDDAWAALAGALVVALFPFRVTQLAGHANGFLSFLVPLTVYLVERTLRGARWGWWALAAGTAYFFSGAMEFHIVYHLTLFLGLYLPFRFLFPLSDWLEPRVAAAPATPAPPPLLQAGVLAGGAGIGLAAFHAADRAFDLGVPRGWAFTAAACAYLLWLLWRGLARAARSYFAPPREGFDEALGLPLAALGLLALVPVGSRAGLPQFGRATAALALALSGGLLAWRLHGAGGARLREGWRGLLAARGRRYLLLGALMGCTLAFLAVIRRFLFAPSVAGGGRRFTDVTAFSPAPADLFAPLNGSSEKLVYLGSAALLLAAAGVAAIRAIRDPRRRLLAAFFAGTFLVGTLLAVGPNLPGLPLYHLLYRTVPMFNFPRVAGRIMTVAVLGLAALVTAGLAAMRRSGRGNPLVFTLFALALLALDYHPRRAPGLATLPQGHPVYERLERECTPGEPILELPVWPGDTAWSSIYLWFATRYRHPLVNGYSPATPRDYVERVFRPLYPLDFGEVRRAQVDLLRTLGVRFVVFHEEAYPRKIGEFPFPVALANLTGSPYLETVAHEAPLWLFRLRDPVPDVEPAFAPSSPVGSLWEGEQWMAPPGVRAEDPLASGGAVAAFPAGPPVELGRRTLRRVLPTGDYRATARLLAAARSLPGLRLEIRHADTGRTLAAAELRAGAAPADGVVDLETRFSLDGPTPVAAVLVSDGSAPVRWDFLLLGFAGAPQPPATVEVEELWHMGRPVADPAASGGQAVQLTPGFHPRDWAFAGPDRILPAGRWVAALRYRAAATAAAAPGETFEVGISGAAAPLAAAPLPPAATAGYRELRLPFALARSAPVRVRVFFPGARELVLDRIAFAHAE